MRPHPPINRSARQHRAPNAHWVLVLVTGSWLFLLTGCTVFTSPVRPPADEQTLPAAVQASLAKAPDDGCEDVTGVIHVHTHDSHDAHGTFEDLVRVANAQRLDYVVITEHNTLKGLREGRQGWHGMTLVLIGEELSTRGGHYLALNITQEIDYHKLTTQEVIDEVNRQGGLGFIAHPYFKKRRWTEWTVSGFTGIEAYNVAHDTLDENRVRLGMWLLMVPNEAFYFSILDRPYDPLHRWDELILRHGRVVGIGSCDAHEFHLMGVKFAPYEDMFRLARTHLLIPTTHASGEQDSPSHVSLTDSAVYEALREGHAYFSVELTAPARGFTFVAKDASGLLGIMGDEITWRAGLRLAVWLPSPGAITLMWNGQPMSSTTAQTWEMPVKLPGVYRIEVMRHDKPWIFSNPIYVHPAPEPVEG